MKRGVTSRVALGDGGKLKFERVMAGEYICTTEVGTYQIDCVTRIVTRGKWCRDEDAWRLRLSTGYQKWVGLGVHRTMTDARIEANLHYGKKIGDQGAR